MSLLVAYSQLSFDGVTKDTHEIAAFNVSMQINAINHAPTHVNNPISYLRRSWLCAVDAAAERSATITAATDPVHSLDLSQQ